MLFYVWNGIVLAANFYIDCIVRGKAKFISNTQVHQTSGIFNDVKGDIAEGMVRSKHVEL